ncbi:MAG: methyl-accepting chemotaxis protein [Myxococcota bacterium]|jgi:methyl-accepting chemotaxis protein
MDMDDSEQRQPQRPNASALLSAGLGALTPIAGAAAWAIALEAGASTSQAIATVALVSGAAGFWIFRREARISAGLRALADVNDRIQAGNAIPNLAPETMGILSIAGKTINALVMTSIRICTRIDTLLGLMKELPEHVVALISNLQMNVEEQEGRVEEAASLLVHMKTSMRQIDERVDLLVDATTESSSSVVELESSVDEVVRNAASLHQSAEVSASSVSDMGASLQQVADATEKLESLAEDTATSMIELDASLRQVGSNVSQASELTQELSAGAAEGARAVSDTIGDIEQIRDRTEQARAGLAKLVSRMSEIDKIVDVIGDINDETKLVSLNAAIISAQAGEHGRAFLVVANHVKALARRTTTSTSEIASLIQAVQRDSDTAVEAMELGVDAIEQGVSRSRSAGETLRRLKESADLASARVSEIERATSEQTERTGAVAKGSQETSDMVRQIAAAMATQSKAIDQVHVSAQAALDLCRYVHLATDEQRQSTRGIAASMVSMTDMILAIRESATAHDRAAGEVTTAVTSLLGNQQIAEGEIPKLRELLAHLGENAHEIAGELNRVHGRVTAGRG